MSSKTSINDLAQKYMISESTSYIQNKNFRKLSEEDKIAISNDLVTKMFNDIMQKSSGLDYDIVEKSEGDFTKISGNDTLNTINLLIQLKSQMKQTDLSIIDELKMAYDNIVNLKGNFQTGFKLEKDIVKILYVNIATALITSTSFVLASSLDFIKDPYGTYDFHFKENLKASRYNTYAYIDTIKKFNKMVTSGEMAKFFTYALGKDSFHPVPIFAGGLAVIAVVGISSLIIPTIRELVYLFMNKRIKVAEYLRLQKTLLEINAEKISVNKSKSSSVKKQTEMAKTFGELADKIDVDFKQTESKAKMDIQNNDKILKKDLHDDKDHILKTAPEPSIDRSMVNDNSII